MSGHGHVKPNPDGSRTRCGGPGICGVCSMEAAREWVAMRAERDALRAALVVISAGFVAVVLFGWID